MSGKFVDGGEIVFLDDIIIHEEEVVKPFSIPEVPLFSREELTVVYKGECYVMRSAQSDEIKGDRIKVYTQTYNLVRVQPTERVEVRWFTSNQGLIEQIQRDFISRCVDGISLNGNVAGTLGHQLSAELIERIGNSYAGKDENKKQVVEAINNGETAFRTIAISERSLFLDEKVYDLISLVEYLSGFKKAFDPKFLEEVTKYSKTKSPREVAEKLDENKDKLSPRALFFIRDKIWNGERSFEINLGGEYLVPQYRGSIQPVIDQYSAVLREKIKHDAAKKYR